MDFNHICPIYGNDSYLVVELDLSLEYGSVQNKFLFFFFLGGDFCGIMEGMDYKH